MRIYFTKAVVESDGTLRVSVASGLPAGPAEVVVVVQPVAAAAPAESWWSRLKKSRADLEAQGHRFRSKEEIDAEIDALRGDS